MKLKKFIVFGMLFLIIMLPVCFAQSLEVTGFAGKDNIQNYARPDDVATMRIKAMIPMDLSISKSQIQICKGNLCSFPESCNAEESFGKDIFHECIYKETLAGESGLFDYNLRLRDDDGNTVKTISTFLGIDNQPPKLFFFDIKPRETKDKAKIIIDVQDYGSTEGDASYCSGIEKIDFYNKDSGKALLSKTYAPGECDIHDEIDYLHKTTADSEKINLCAKAYDHFNQATDEFCIPFAFDNQGPVFKRLVLAKDDQPVTHIPAEGGTFDLMLEIDDVSEIESVIADLSKIAGKPVKKNFDYRIDNIFYWKDFEITSKTVCEADVQAVDALGNSANASLTCNIGIDQTGPEVKNIKSSYEDYAGEPVIAPHAVITAKILEQGVGLYKKEIYLDAKEIGVGVLQADECKNISETMWECYWNDITPSVRDGDYQIRIDEKSRDDLDNNIRQVASLDVVTYSEAPRISQISQYPIGPTSEDTVEFTLRVTNSKTEPNVFVDASAISTESFPKQASCTAAGIDEWECYVDISQLNEMYMHEWITFFVRSGEAGKQEVPFEISIYEPEPAEGIDFYTITSVNKKPGKGFDKRMVYTTSVPVYLQPNIKSKYPNKDIEIIENIAECSAENVSDIYMIPGDPENPFIVVKSSTGIAEMDSPVQVDCTMSLRIRQGDRIYKNPEIETFSASIPVYNNPLGSVSENAQAQIDAINERIWDLQKRTNRWSDVNDWLAMIVTIAQSLAQADDIMTYIVGALWLVSVVLYELRVIKFAGIGDACKWLAELLWKDISCNVLNNVIHKDLIMNLVWNPGLVGTEIFSANFWTGLGKSFATLVKTVSIIYSCQMCDYSSALYSGVQKMIYGDMSMDIEDQRGKPTALETFTVYDWSPYKSIHFATSCFCIPGVVYNMRKEVQIHCIFRNCIEQNAELGLPFDNCQQTFKEQNCLYVDGAAWRISGGTAIAPVLSNLLTVVLEQLPLMITSRAWSLICDPDCGIFRAEDDKGNKDTKDCDAYGLSAKGVGGENSAYPDECNKNPEEDWEVPLCAIWTGTLMMQETDFFGKNMFDWSAYTAELEGEDYCD